jgi:endonuclease/exonuclease/phosphatase (EEP) superfamily protein YafD
MGSQAFCLRGLYCFDQRIPAIRFREPLKARVSAWNLLTLLVVGMGLCTIAGFGARVWWILELCCHFRVQYLTGALLAAGVFLLGRRRKHAVSALVIAVINAAVVLPYFLGGDAAPRFGERAAGEDVGRVLRAALVNVQKSNRSFDRVIEFLRGTEADFVVLLETDETWLRKLQSGLVDYPYVISEPREDNFGMTFLSRLPFVRSDVLWMSDLALPNLSARFLVDGRELTVLGAHAVPPKSPDFARCRNQHLSAISRFVSLRDGPVVVLGDLNVTPWSPHFGGRLEEAGLVDARRGFGLLPTWPTWLPPLRIPIDHCLATRDVMVRDFGVRRSVGSDHFPVVVEFMLGP